MILFCDVEGVGRKSGFEWGRQQAPINRAWKSCDLIADMAH